MLNAGYHRFYFDIFETSRIPYPFTAVGLVCAQPGDPVPEVIPEPPPRKTGSLVRVRFVPGYMTPVLDTAYRKRVVPEMPGFAIDLEGITDLEAYMAAHLKPRLRSSVRNKPGKLAKDFPIRYQLYFGGIDGKTYGFLMAELKRMIEGRFENRDTDHERLKEWDRITELFLPLIRDRKASLFVIYNGEQPIAMSLNYHLGPVFLMAIPSFDPDYSPYGPGHILISKQLSWCLENGYRLFDMSMGDLRYKHDWCNTQYAFETWLVYRRGGVSGFLKAGLWYGILQTKRFLKSLGVHRYYHRALRLIRGKRG